MRIEYLEEFVVLCESKSMSSAARELHLSQSCLSKHMAALEEEFGIRLFSRTRGTLRPTKAGRALCEDARGLVGAYRRSAEEVRAVGTGGQSTVKLAYECDAAKPLIGPLKHWFEVHKPTLAFKPVAADAETLKHMLAAYAVDGVVCIDVDGAFRDSCNSMPLYREDMVVVMDRKNPLARREALRFSDLADERIYRPDGSAYPELSRWLAQRYDAAELRDARFVAFDDPRMVFDMIDNVGGVAVVASHNEYLYRSRFAFVPIVPEEQHILELRLFWLRESEQSRNALQGIALMRRACRAACEELPASLRMADALG